MIYAFIIFILICNFFVLFTLSKNDFVLLRKNISQTALFDIAFFMIVSAFILGRIVYILDSARFTLFYWLSFFHIFKFPGISLLGVYLGIILPIFYFRRKKVLLRTLDIFFLSAYLLFPLSIFIRDGMSNLPLKILIMIVSIIFFGILIRFHRNYTIHDGSATLIILLLVSLDTLFFNGVFHKTLFLLSFAQWISIAVGVIVTIIFILNERFIKHK